MRCFGSAGYSYDFVQHGLSGDPFYNFFRLNNSTARGGTPFVGAGAELSWSFIPALSLIAGARVRYFLDFFADMAFSIGTSYNMHVGGPKAVEPPMQRAAALKKTAYPEPSVRPEGSMIEKLSQFLMPEEPTLLTLSHQINSIIGPNMSRVVDRNLQSAIGCHEAIQLLGIACISAGTESGTAVDSVKSPLQTFRDRSGDCRDISILNCSLLQSLQVETAFITIPGHVFMAFALASSEEAARRTFNHTDELIFRDGKAWVPLDVMESEGSFLAEWQAGATEWRKAGKKKHFYPVRGVENTQPAVGSPGSSNSPLLLDQPQVVSSFQRELARLATREIHDREAALLAAVGQSNGSPQALNALGVLYARWDVLGKAEAQFQAAVKRNEYAPALVNLGNLRLLGGFPEEAVGFYQRAAAAAPHDPAVLLGLARTNHELQNWELARQEYDELQTRSPQLAAQFSYLGMQEEAAAWEAKSSEVRDMMVWGEEK